MPLLRKQPFVKEKISPSLKPNDEVFHCKLTNEVFTDYEKFFERIILCNSLVWNCALTGKAGLTYQEALESEEKAKKQLASFPDYLLKPILFLASLTHRCRLVELTEDVFGFCKDRYFIGEVVEVTQAGESKKTCKVIRIIPPDNSAPAKEDDADSVICLDSDSEDEKLSKSKSSNAGSKNGLDVPHASFQYMVQGVKETNIYIVEADNIGRKKSVFTRDKCKLFLKKHCASESDGIWKVQGKYIRKFRLREAKFHDFFEGPIPIFPVSAAKKRASKGASSSVVDLTDEDLSKKAKDEKKKKKKEKKDLQGRNEFEGGKQSLKKMEQKVAELIPVVPAVPVMTPEERAALKEKLKQEKLAEKLARKEEMKKKMEEERQKRKEEKERERDKKREEKRLQEEYLREMSKPRDDLECDDLKDLPVPTPVQLRIPQELFGDVAMVLEFLNSFGVLFDYKESFPGGISLADICKGVTETSTNNLYSDLIRFLLTSIFNLQTEEEEEEEELDDDDQDTSIKGNLDWANHDNSYSDILKTANIAAMWPQLHYGTPLRKLHLDSFTMSEVLRLHFLASGAKATDKNNRFRYQQRGGYTSFDDAGLEFLRNEPTVMKNLSDKNIFDLTPGDKLKVLIALMNQVLTYVACRDYVEDSYEKMKKAKYDLKLYQSAEQRREREEAAYWYKKKMEEKAKERELEAQKKEQKRKEREEKIELEQMRGRCYMEQKEFPADKAARLLELQQKEFKDRQEKKMAAENPEEKKDEGEPENEETKDSNKEKVDRKSARQKAKEDKGIEERELLTENVDWEKMTVEKKAKIKEMYLKKEVELTKLIDNMQQGYAMTPLGSDRTFRRYWVFQSIPGLFVEADLEHIPDEIFQNLAQPTIVSKAFESDSLPLKINGVSPSGEEKSTSSDKENDSFDHGKTPNKPGAANNTMGEALTALESKTNVIDNDQGAGDSVVVTSVNNLETPMEIDEKKTIPCQSVQEQISQMNQVRWAYYNTREQLDKLLDSLNPRGFREGPLKQNLIEQKVKVLSSMEECPVSNLNCDQDGTQNAKSGVRYQSVKSRNRKMQGAVRNASASELMELNLREMLLYIEERIFAGGLGAIKVKNRMAWREAIEMGNYIQQDESLSWVGRTQSQVEIEKKQKEWREKKSAKSKDKKMEVGDAETDYDKWDDNIAIVVFDLSKALLQIERGVEARYRNPPLGEGEAAKKSRQLAAMKAKIAKGKQKETGDEDDLKDDESKMAPLDRWEVSLMSCTSLPQVFLHLSVLEESIAWSKSALNATCRICRRKSDGESMLLCDACDRGYHMYCLKPPVKQIPRGDWYCKDCRPKDLPRTPRKRRKSIFEEEEEQEDEQIESSNEEDSSDDESDDDDDDDDEEEDSDDEDGDGDETMETEDSSDDEEEEGDNSDESDDSEDTEVVATPVKVKLLKAFTKKKPLSGRSTPNSVQSGRSSKGSKATGNKSARNSLELAKSSSASRLSTGKKTARNSLEPAASKSRKSLEAPKSASKSSRRSLEPGSKQAASKTRQSLETNGREARKRGADLDLDEPSSKKMTTSKSRTSTGVQLMKQCEDLLVEITDHESSWPFLLPVNKRDAPDYFDVIKQPMDLGTIRNKVHKYEYNSSAELLTDMRLVFRNCRDYNLPTAPEYQAGEKLARHFEKRVRDLKLEENIGKTGTPNTSPGGRRARR